jgi:predicted Zn-dependent peptidase
MKVLKADSGITVLYRYVPSKLTSVHYVVKCGAIDERVAKEYGLCHALEHMFFAGTKNRSWDQVLSGFRNTGAYSNAFTSLQITDFELLVPSENLEPAFEVLADIMYNSTFPEDRWNAVERSAIVNELLSYENDPEWFLEVQAMTHALGGSRKYHHPGGSIRAVKAAKVGDLVTFKDRFYSGDNVFLSIVGGLTEDEVLGIVNRYDRWNPAPPEPRLPASNSFNYKARNYIREGAGQPLIFFCKPIKKAREVPDILAEEIAIELLNNHLLLEIREKQGLCYSIEADAFNDMPHSNYLTISTATSSQEAKEKTVEEITKALHAFVERGLSSELINQARMDLYRKNLTAENSPTDVSSWIAHAWLNGSTNDRFDGSHEKLKSITDEKVIETARACVSGDYKISTLEDTEEIEDYQECNED